MLISAAEVMRERGAAGVTIDEVLTRSGAPRGSVYYHFPNGRNQILAEALHYAGEAITADIDDAASRGAKALLRQFVDFWERGSPEATTTPAARWSPRRSARPKTKSGVRRGGADLRALAYGADVGVRRRRLRGAGCRSLAVMSIAALEGAVVLCRSAAAANRCTRSTNSSNSWSRQGNSSVATEFPDRLPPRLLPDRYRLHVAGLVAGRQRLGFLEAEHGLAHRQCPGAGLGDQHLGARSST